MIINKVNKKADAVFSDLTAKLKKQLEEEEAKESNMKMTKVQEAMKKQL